MTTILTLRLDDAAQARFSALRREHFPPERNQIDAHVTLFHALPDRSEEVAAIAAEVSCFAVRVTGLRPLGKGVAYTLASAELAEVHRRLAAVFAEDLTPQDRQGFRPHVVVQNKVTPAEARELLHRLQGTFVPWEASGVGLDLWEYLGGPWRHLRTFPFAGV